MTQIDTMTQFEALPVGSMISLRRESAARQHWTHTTDGQWSCPQQEGLVATRFFRGAVESGLVHLASSSVDEDPIWKIGAWFAPNTGSGNRFFVTNENMSGRVHNCIQISDYRADRAVITQQQIDDGTYTPVEGSSGNATWWNEVVSALVPKALPQSLTDPLIAYAGKVNDDDLFALLDEQGVDTAPRTTLIADGETVIDVNALTAQVGSGAVATMNEVRVPWSKTIESVRVKRGCLCEMTWTDAVLDEQALLGSLPASHDRDSLKVAIACPVHAG